MKLTFHVSTTTRNFYRPRFLFAFPVLAELPEVRRLRCRSCSVTAAASAAARFLFVICPLGTTAPVGLRVAGRPFLRPTFLVDIELSYR